MGDHDRIAGATRQATCIPKKPRLQRASDRARVRSIAGPDFYLAVQTYAVDLESITDEDLEDQPDFFAVDAVRGWLATLPTPLQRIYHLLFIDECSQREAAEILGISQPRVAQQYRALIEKGRRALASLVA